jgi:hypothetical protein
MIRFLLFFSLAGCSYAAIKADPSDNVNSSSTLEESLPSDSTCAVYQGNVCLSPIAHPEKPAVPK